MNKDGKLDSYENRCLPAGKRVNDLLEQMSLEEMVGLMFCPIIGMHPDGSLVEDQSFYSQIGSTEAIIRRHISHEGSFLPMRPEVVALHWVFGDKPRSRMSAIIRHLSSVMILLLSTKQKRAVLLPQRE